MREDRLQKSGNSSELEFQGSVSEVEPGGSGSVSEASEAILLQQKPPRLMNVLLFCMWVENIFCHFFSQFPETFIKRDDGMKTLFVSSDVINKKYIASEHARLPFFKKRNPASQSYN